MSAKIAEGCSKYYLKTVTIANISTVAIMCVDYNLGIAPTMLTGAQLDDQNMFMAWSNKTI